MSKEHDERDPHKPDAGIGRRASDTTRLDLPPDLVLADVATSMRIRRLIGTGYGFMAAIFIVSALGFFFGDDNSKSVISKQLSDSFETAWNVTWLLGGLLVFYGAIRPRTVVELIGHGFVIAAVVPYMVAVITVSGFVPTTWLCIIIMGFINLRVYFLLVFAPRLLFVLRVKLPKPGKGGEGA